jgi:hypothetical protein
MHDKFLKLGMGAPYVIPHLLTKWNIQILLGLHVVSFLSSDIFEF